MSRWPIAQAMSSGDPIEGNPSSREGLAALERREKNVKGAGQGRIPWRTKMEDTDRGNMGLAPSGHDGAHPLRINAPVGIAKSRTRCFLHQFFPPGEFVA